jgi:hypothetical protein
MHVVIALLTRVFVEVFKQLNSGLFIIMHYYGANHGI